MKVALVYDRANKWGGAERVLLTLHELFPKAPLYTTVYDSQKASWVKNFPKVIPSFLQKIPFAKTNHEFLGTFTPIAFESFDFRGYDLVISVTSESAKGIITDPETLHICYCLTPTRYLWSGYDFYLRNPGRPGKIPFFPYLAKPFLWYTRYWDKNAAQRPDKMIAISSAVKERIKKYYKRNSEIIYPSVDIDFFKDKKRDSTKKENFYLLVSRLVPYKRVDLAIKAFNELGLPLFIIGKGTERKNLKRIAKSNIKFLGELTDEKLRDYYRRSKALIMPQEEDFGIVAVEAQAAGTPVIAFKKGGALDTVIEEETGVFFDQQKPESLIKGVNKFKKLKFKKENLLKNALRFSKENFKQNFLELINNEFNR